MSRHHLVIGLSLLLGCASVTGAERISGSTLQRWLGTAFVLAVYEPATRTSSLIRFRRDEVETYWTTGVGFRGIWQGWAEIEDDALCLSYLGEAGEWCFHLLPVDGEHGELRTIGSNSPPARYVLMDPPFLPQAPADQ